MFNLLYSKQDPNNYLAHCISFLVMRIFKIFSLSNVQIHNTVLLTTVTMLHITSLLLIYCTAFIFLNG